MTEHNDSQQDSTAPCQDVSPTYLPLLAMLEGLPLLDGRASRIPAMVKAHVGAQMAYVGAWHMRAVCKEWLELIDAIMKDIISAIVASEESRARAYSSLTVWSAPGREAIGIDVDRRRAERHGTDRDSRITGVTIHLYRPSVSTQYRVHWTDGSPRVVTRHMSTTTGSPLTDETESRWAAFCDNLSGWVIRAEHPDAVIDI